MARAARYQPTTTRRSADGQPKTRISLAAEAPTSMGTWSTNLVDPSGGGPIDWLLTGEWNLSPEVGAGGNAGFGVPSIWTAAVFLWCVDSMVVDEEGYVCTL